MHVHMSPLMRQCLGATTRELEKEFRGVFSRETVARCVEESYDRIGDRPTVGPNFMPVIIERFARERLWAVAQADGRVEKPLPELVFVCEHNAGRSQMAAAFARHLSNGWVAVRSAGSHPDQQIDAVVVQAMGELGVDVACEFPKPLTDEVVRAADVVITMGCGDACPIYPGKKYEDWQLDDPAGQDVATVRVIRDELDRRVRKLIGELLPDDAPAAS